MFGSDIACGPCKYLRRKYVSGCIFAPHFSNEDATAHFAPMHMVFGTSRISKLLSNLPVNDRCGAAMTIAYEAHTGLKIL
ncbi:hypothetical protein Pyn_23060 [Prunus yedoensis var. nudiflora]|uniref:LOB domain-containing protein n=1 Tax=Prunus yedoensis var. nudiflora TaxID=2094558 RepID=A0A314UD82_PRUYE|nr:hypothetical protein Pyn_23060 [Prunus yedoensis var. nudiflora]